MPVEKKAASPCIEICALNEDDVCIGCYRSAREISEWSMLDNDARLEVLACAARRRREDGAFL